MSDEDRTRPRRFNGLPVKTIRVTVISGPDAGVVVGAQDDALTIGTAESNTLCLTDPTVSHFHLELRRKGARILVHDCGSTNGTDVGVAFVQGNSVAVVPGTTVRVGETVLRLEDGDVVMVEAEGGDGFGGLLGRSAVMRRLFASIAKVASKNTPVLLVGESGTGKELIAEAIHRLHAAANKDGPFVTVDCGATVPTLFASELFGHERGAFTGADQRREGAFARANRGSLFLDEIGEVPLEIQSTLLGALERRRFRRLGASSEQPTECRIISATNRDLRGEVNAGRFRADLYYRLAVVTLHVPPLREHPEDIPRLVEHFLREAGHEGAVSEVFSPTAMTDLEGHVWPGNVRELRNVVEATLVMGPVGLHREDEPTSSGASPSGSHEAGVSYKEARRRVLDRFEKEYLASLLAATGGNVRQAARVAQMDRSYLMKLLKDHGLP